MRRAEKPLSKSEYVRTAKKNRSRTKWIASTILFQSTALAGTLAGVPVPFYAGRTYSRAYAQAVSCNSLTSETASGVNKSEFEGRRQTIKNETLSCTVYTGDTNTPQYAYVGAYMALIRPGSKKGGYVDDSYRGQHYENTHSNWGWDSPSVSVINNANIYANQPASTQLLQGPASAATGTLRTAAQQFNALSAVSLGALNWSGDTDNMQTGGGDGGGVYIRNNSNVSSKFGGGVFGLSMGGATKHADGVNEGSPGAGETVTIKSFGIVTGDSFGVAALSIGGPGTYVDSDNFIYGAPGGYATVNIYNSVYVTGQGPAVAAVSYGGNTPYNFNSFNTQPQKGGNGGASKRVEVYLGTTETPMSGTISTQSAGPILFGTRYETGFPLTRSTGAGIFAISRSGDSLPSGGANDFGLFAEATYVNVLSSGQTYIKTYGDQSPGILAISQGGKAYNTYYTGHAGNASVSLTGGGSVATRGDVSTGIDASSLGGGLGSSAVTVVNDFTINTKGDASHGISAISASNGGGDYKLSSAGKFTWGGDRGFSGNAGDVTVTNRGDIKTYGVDSYGLIAMSIGGQGGVLRSEAALQTDKFGAINSKDTYQNVGAASGGQSAAKVYVTNHGSITTYGGYSSGQSGTALGGTAILAQSIGGGGGVNIGGGAAGNFGASGGNGTDGALIKINNYGALTTHGSEAHGIVAQSVGGGGGSGRNGGGFFVAVGGSGGNGGAGGRD